MAGPGLSPSLSVPRARSAPCAASFGRHPPSLPPSAAPVPFGLRANPHWSFQRLQRCPLAGQLPDFLGPVARSTFVLSPCLATRVGGKTPDLRGSTAISSFPVTWRDHLGSPALLQGPDGPSSLYPECSEPWQRATRAASRAQHGRAHEAELVLSAHVLLSQSKPPGHTGL